jgi:hypothetical protein
VLDAERKWFVEVSFLEITSFIRGSDESFPAISIIDEKSNNLFSLLNF